MTRGIRSKTAVVVVCAALIVSGCGSTAPAGEGPAPTRSTAGGVVATASATSDAEYSTNPLVPVAEVHRICALLVPDALSRGADHTWIYRAEQSGDTNTNAIDSTVAARCVYSDVDDGYELDVEVMLTPATANTMMQDLGCCTSPWTSVAGLGDEAYFERIGGAGTGVGGLYTRSGDVWYEIEMERRTSDSTGVDGGTQAELIAVMQTVIAIHPQFSVAGD